MNETILNHLGCLCNQTIVSDDVAKDDDSTVNGGEAEVVPEHTPDPVDNESQAAIETQPVEEKHTDDHTSEPEKKPQPVIGLDGKTEDGSMPYEILMEKLEWLK